MLETEAFETEFADFDDLGDTESREHSIIALAIGF
jgi:hypothetical protein